MNHVTFIGELQDSPATHVSHAGDSVKFTVAVVETGADGKAHALFVPCVAWGAEALAASSYRRGDCVMVDGGLRYRRRTANGDAGGFFVHVDSMRKLVQ